MKIEFIGPASLAQDGGVIFPAKLDGKNIECHFSYEALEDVDPDSVMGSALEHFQKHRLILLSAAEKKILSGHVHEGRVQVFSNDLDIH